MFDGINPDIDGIPNKYITPNIEITNTSFNLDVTQKKDKYYAIMSFLSPLNITLNTTLPFGWFLNSMSINKQWTNLILLTCRTPILIYHQRGSYAVCLGNLLQISEENNKIGQFINLTQHANIRNAQATWQEIELQLAGKTLRYAQQNGQLTREYDAGTESNNIIYQTSYSNGQYSGIISPQANDFYQSNINVPYSNFNDVSILKCLIQISMLGNCFNNNNYYYTNTNSVIIIWINNGNITFTGKYWTKPYISPDENPQNYTTTQLINKIMLRIRNDPNIMDQINRELGLERNTIRFADFGRDNTPIYYRITQERYSTYLNEPNQNDNHPYKTDIFFATKLFHATLGLEDFLKQEFALFFAGILGHSWDTLLKFFIYRNNGRTSEREFQKFKTDHQGFQLSKHYGTPIASYIYDFKNAENINYMGNYNAVNFSRVLNEKLINIRDKITKRTDYTPPDIPNCLIPIVFDNALLQCKTSCYRSFKKLLKLMKTRKQRSFLFDRLTQFGRRAMTILDPYGIFMHYHNLERGLEPAWRQNLALDEERPNEPAEPQIININLRQEPQQQRQNLEQIQNQNIIIQPPPLNPQGPYGPNPNINDILINYIPQHPHAGIGFNPQYMQDQQLREEAFNEAINQNLNIDDDDKEINDEFKKAQKKRENIFKQKRKQQKHNSTLFNETEEYENNKDNESILNKSWNSIKNTANAIESIYKFGRIGLNLYRGARAIYNNF